MIKVFVRHKVEDFAKWKYVFDDFLGHRKTSGELSYSIGHLPNEPNNLCLIFEWDNLENANAFLGSEILKTTMQAAGVIEAPDISVFEVYNEGKT